MPRSDLSGNKASTEDTEGYVTISQAFGWVTGEWNVPDVNPVADGRGSWVSLAWIGIDGDTDVTQIGTLQSVTNVFGPANMTENGNVVATTTVQTPTLIKIAYTGS
jgi:Peptidase A4 family